MRRIFALLPTLIIISVIASPPSEAAIKSNGSVAGTVMTEEGKGLLGAVVALFSQEGNHAVVSFTKSDQHGAYNLTDLAPGA